MNDLTEIEIRALKIEQLIFHVVQHEDSEPILLDETPIGSFEGFFLDRVRETLTGNHYQFLNGSATCQLLEGISKDPRKFVSNSKQLAINFHAARDKRMKPGAIMLMRLHTGKRELFSLIKFDHEIVLAYNVVANSRAILQEIVNNFTGSKKAIQKSALIELNDQGGDLIVVDNTVGYDITDYFRGFLNVHRVDSESDLTNAVHEAIIQTAIAHKNDLPNEVTSTMRSNSFQAIQSLKYFETSEFFNKVFGTYASESMLKTFQAQLKKRGIDGDTFKFDKQATLPPTMHKYRTREGVRIQYSETAKPTVTIDSGKGRNPTTIIIKTQQLIEE